MSALEETLADYRAGGLTSGPHVLSHLRPDLDRRGIVTVGALERMEDGSQASCAALVIVRQRPMTAKGFCFLTLEDETGIGNAVITPLRYSALRHGRRKAPAETSTSSSERVADPVLLGPRCA